MSALLSTGLPRMKNRQKKAKVWGFILGPLILVSVSFLFWMVDQAGEGSEMANNLGVKEGSLTACPNRDNCRNSDDPQEKFQIAAITDSDGEKWQRLADVMSSLPRAKLISQSENYLHFTQSSKLMRFVDDIEFHNRPEIGEIAVRSASRLGYRDFGVNMDRVENIRTILKNKSF